MKVVILAGGLGTRISEESQFKLVISFITAMLLSITPTAVMR